MRLILTFIVVLSLNSCGKTDKSQGINFGVIDKTDTLSHFYYEGHKKYQFYDSSGEDTLFSSEESLAKIPGHFRFGIKDRLGHSNRFLLFDTVVEFPLRFPKEPQVPFLEDEFAIGYDYSIELLENYIDSLNRPIRKYETYVAIDKLTKDTIIFQEVNYVINNRSLITSFIIYNNFETREEMRLVLEDAREKITESVVEKLHLKKN